jgi:hypothetical protein
MNNDVATSAMSRHPRIKKHLRAQSIGRHRGLALIFEMLEDRIVPSTITVSSTLDLHHYNVDVTPAQLAAGQDLGTGNSDASVTLLDGITAADNASGSTAIILQAGQTYTLWSR